MLIKNPLFMHLENEFSQRYYEIIHHRLLNPYDGYIEKHHIWPRALGGGNGEENIVRLTAKEHFECHMLLPKFLEGNAKYRMVLPAFRMSQWKSEKHKGERNYEIDANSYQFLKEQYSLAQSILRTGKTATEETRRKQSAAHLGKSRALHNQQTKEQISNSLLGTTQSKETCIKKSNSRQGKEFKTYWIQDERGNTFEVLSMNNFCISLNPKYKLNSFKAGLMRTLKSNSFYNGYRILKCTYRSNNG